MASRWCTIALCTGIMLSASVARGEPRVVIVETRDAPTLPGLAAQVQLHAGRAVTVRTVQDPSSSSLTYASRASAIVSEQAATIVVWVAAVPGDSEQQRTYLVFAAGRFPGRALIELVRLDASTPPGEVERTVALKIAGLFDLVVAPRPLSAALEVPVTRAASWRVELAGSFVAETGDRELDGRVSLGVDHRWALGDWVMGAGLAAHWQPSNTIAAPPGVVSIDEIGARAALGLEYPGPRMTGFVRPHATAAVLLAEGTSVAGSQGSATVFSPTLGGDVGARWRLSDSIELTTAVGADVALTRQQFLVDGMPAADLRRVRATLTLGLSIELR